MPRKFIVALVAMLALVVGAAAYAAIPDANRVIHGCYDNRTGILRAIDSEAGVSCRANETAIDWNQRGPAGPAGPQGIQGETGPAGPAGADGQDGVDGSVHAYARIAPDGSVNEALSKNVSDANVSHPASGVYCVRGLGFDPKVAVGNGVAGITGTIDGGFTASPSAYTTVAAQALEAPATTFLAICDTSATPVEDRARVRIYTFAVQSGTPQDRPFQILLD